MLYNENGYPFRHSRESPEIRRFLLCRTFRFLSKNYAIKPSILSIKSQGQQIRYVCLDVLHDVTIRIS